MSSINQKVQQLLDLLFEDRLISGLQVVQKGHWISEQTASFDARTGAVVRNTSEEEIKLIILPFQGGFQEAMAAGSRLPTSTETLGVARGEVKFVMQPLEKEAHQALSDEIQLGNSRYQISAVQPIWLGEKVVLWEVVAR